MTFQNTFQNRLANKIITEQEEYLQRQKAGLCVGCGGYNNMKPKLLCSDCQAQKNNQKQTKRKFNYVGRKEYEYRKEHGYCVNCGRENNRLPKVMCSTCAQYQKTYREKQKQIKKSRKEKENQKEKEIVKHNTKFLNQKKENYTEKLQPQPEESTGYTQPRKPIKWVNIKDLMKKEQDEVNKKVTKLTGGVKIKTTNNEFTKGFELGRRLGRKKLYEEINELFDEIATDTIDAEDLKDILKLVKA